MTDANKQQSATSSATVETELRRKMRLNPPAVTQRSTPKVEPPPITKVREQVA